MHRLIHRHFAIFVYRVISGNYSRQTLDKNYYFCKCLSWYLLTMKTKDILKDVAVMIVIDNRIRFLRNYMTKIWNVLERTENYLLFQITSRNFKCDILSISLNECFFQNVKYMWMNSTIRRSLLTAKNHSPASF